MDGGLGKAFCNGGKHGRWVLARWTLPETDRCQPVLGRGDSDTCGYQFIRQIVQLSALAKATQAA